MHLPVLTDEVLGYLEPQTGDTVLDATFGGGGHSEEILNRILPGGKLIAFDRDEEAIERGRKKFEPYADSIVLINEDYRDMRKVLPHYGIEKIDGAVFDLGMSSYQLDDVARGLSYRNDGPLDMRFDRSGGITAGEVVNTFSRDMLAEIIKENGEERHSGLIASAIVKARTNSEIKTTLQLAEIISRAAGRYYRAWKLHPACRTFQALRIYVNDEINAVPGGLRTAVDLLAPGKRVCVISFHSIEDRAVKVFFREQARTRKIKLVNKKPILPSSKEKAHNSRARSAKLRVVEKI